MRLWRGTFKNAKQAGDWHLKSVEGGNHMKNANYRRAGRIRLTKAEFRRRLLEDLKHDI
jgi:hypothetical protein